MNLVGKISTLVSSVEPLPINRTQPGNKKVKFSETTRAKKKFSIRLEKARPPNRPRPKTGALTSSEWITKTTKLSRLNNSELLIR